MANNLSPFEQYIQSRISGGPQFMADQRSALEAAQQKSQSSIDQLRGIYSDPSNVEVSPWGAMGLGLMKGTKSGSFNEGMYNGLSAAMAAQTYNKEQNLSRMEKLAKLSELEGMLSRQRATDERTLYDTGTGYITNTVNDQGILADQQLDDIQLGSRPLGVGEQGPVAPDQTPEAQAELVYQDYMRNPQRYAGAQGQAMVKNAVDTLNNARTNARYLQTAQMRQKPGAGEGRVMPNSPEGRRISGRLKGFDDAADAGREIMGNVAKLRRSRAAVDYEGNWGANAWADWMGWTDSGAAGQLVNADATNFKLELTAKLKGAISDAEQAMLTKASPGLEMNDAAADPLMTAYDAAGRRAVERAKFMKSWFQQNGSDYGADEAWDQYVHDYPIIEEDGNGNISVNENNVDNWQAYLQGGGEQPQHEGSGYPTDPDEVVGKDASGNDITWGDIETTAEENGMTVEQVIERLKGGQ